MVSMATNQKQAKDFELKIRNLRTVIQTLTEANKELQEKYQRASLDHTVTIEDQESRSSIDRRAIREKVRRASVGDQSEGNRANSAI